jgi:RNA polymerase sigma factor (sigma-70 family)
MPAPDLTHNHKLIQAIERIQLGDSVGFETIYHHFIDDVRRWCRCQLGWQDRCDQFEDDLAQEVMLGLWQAICSLTDSCGEQGDKACDFVLFVIRRLVFEQGVNRGKYNKRQKRLRKISLPALYTELTRGHYLGRDQDEVDARDALQIALARISGSKTHEIMDRKLRGESNQEIALAMRLSSRSIRRLLAESKSHLKTFLIA